MEHNFNFEKAKWIWLKERKTNHYAEFVFEIEFNGENTEIFISAKSDYVLFINGKFVDCGQYGDFPELKSVDKLDVTSCLKIGKNNVKILARSIDDDSFLHIKGGHGIIFEVRKNDKLDVYSNAQILSRESLSYSSGATYNITLQLGYGYNCDLSLNDAPYGLSEIVNCDAKFFLRPIKKLEFSPILNSKLLVKGSYILGKGESIFDKIQTAFLSFDNEGEENIVNNDNGDGVYFIIDLLKESSGFLDFELDIDSNSDIVVAFGEHLNDLRVRSKIEDRNFLLFHHGVKGNNTFTSYLRRIGCRYLQFFISANKVKIKKATLIETLYPAKINEKKFDDFLIQNIWDVSLNTLRQCMHEHYEDCPWREQSQYATDSFLQILSGFYAFKTQEFARAALLLMGHEVNEHGLLCLTSPCRQELFIPSFSLSYVQAVCEFYFRTKDIEFLIESKPTVETIFKTFISHIDSTGLIKKFNAWNFYEWTDGHSHPEEENSYHAPLNAMLYASLVKWNKVLLEINQPFDVKRNENIILNLKNSILKYFWNNEKEIFASYFCNGEQKHYSEFTQSVILWAQCCAKEINDKIALTLKDDNNLVKISLSNNYFKYEGLITHDKRNVDFVIKDIKQRWGKMLFNGATSFWETEEGETAFDNAGSLCHGWSAIPIYFIGKYM